MFRRFRGFQRFRMFRGFQRFQKFRNIRNIRNLQNIRRLSIKKELFMPIFPMNLSIASRDIRAASSCAKLFLYITKKRRKKFASYPIVSPDSYCYM